MADKNEWQGSSGETWAAEWRRTDRSFTLLTERLLERTRDFKFREVLDIGCGAGELSLAIARGRPAVSVTGVDVSPQLVATARERGAHLGNVGFTLSDAAEWSAPEGREADLLVSRHGVMFFHDPVAAFANLAATAAPHAALMFSCFRALAENPAFSEVGRLLPDTPPSLANGPGPFAFADKDRVHAILHSGGWTNMMFEEFDYPMIVGAGANPVEDAVSYFSRIGPAARSMAEVQEDAKARFRGRLRTLCERNCREGIVALPAAAWIVTAHKAG